MSDLKATFSTIFRGVKIDVTLEATILAPGEIQVTCAFSREGQPYDVGDPPTRREMSRLCREAAFLNPLENN